MKKIIIQFLLLGIVMPLHSLAESNKLLCSSFLNADLVNENLVLQLAEFGLKFSPKALIRDDEELFIKYKNDGAFSLWLEEVTLRGSLRLGSVSLLEQYTGLTQVEFFRRASPVQWDLTKDRHLSQESAVEGFSNYDISILLMREGDRVLLPDNKGGSFNLEIGKYLGSGYQTMIFEIKSLPDHVLRLPFRAKNMRFKNDTLELAQSRAVMLQMINSRPPSNIIRTVEIKDFGLNGEYMIVEKVEGLSGTTLFDEYAFIIDYFRGTNETNFNQNEVESFARSNRLSVSKVLDVLKLFWSLERAWSNAEGFVDDVNEGQFVFLHELQEWILIDWDKMTD